MSEAKVRSAPVCYLVVLKMKRAKELKRFIHVEECKRVMCGVNDTDLQPELKEHAQDRVV